MKRLNVSTLYRNSCHFKRLMIILSNQEQLKCSSGWRLSSLNKRQICLIAVTVLFDSWNINIEKKRKTLKVKHYFNCEVKKHRKTFSFRMEYSMMFVACGLSDKQEIVLVEDFDLLYLLHLLLI